MLTDVSATQPTSPLSAQCEDHRVFLVQYVDLTEKPLADAKALSAAAQTLTDELCRVPEGAKHPVWLPVERDTARKSLHNDLLNVVNRILHGGDLADTGTSPGPGRFVGMPPLQLNPVQTQNACYAVDLNQAAQARLLKFGITARQVQIKVAGGTLYTFASGLVLMALELSFASLDGADTALPAAMIMEGLYAVGHATDRSHGLRGIVAESRRLLEPVKVGDTVVLDSSQRYGARLKQAADDSAMPARTLLSISGDASQTAVPLRLVFETGETYQGVNELLAHWLKPHGDLASTSRYADALMQEKHGRVFTYFAGVFEPGVGDEALAELAYRTSHRFGADYQIALADVAPHVARPFGNICHAVATQGASVAVRNTGVGFVEQFIGSAIRPTYLPLALIAYHEYLHLRSLTQACAIMPNEADPKTDKEHLQKLRAALVTFRLYLRFSHISDMAHHNTVYEAWRRAMGLDGMLDELALDVREGEEVLRRLHDEHKEQRAEYWRKWSTIGLALGATVLALHVGEAIASLAHPWREWVLSVLNPQQTPLAELKQQQSQLVSAYEAFEAAHHFEELVVGVSVFIGLVIGWVAYKSGKGFGGEE